MKGVLQYQYGCLRKTWQEGYREEVTRTAISFLILALIGFTACSLLPELRERLVSTILDLFGNKALTDDTGALSAVSLLSNNLEACAFSMVYGLIPFIQLPALALGMNALILGILAAHYMATGTSMLVYFAALIPHGIFELPALVLAFSMGLYVCGIMTRRCRGDETAPGLWDCLTVIARHLLLVLLPLLIVAALTESYITPVVVSWFL